MPIHAELIGRVLSLSTEERAELARQLIMSLQPPAPETDADVDAAWESEIERRLGQVDRGEVELRELWQLIELIRAILKRPDAG